jgi:hypothetical protein
MRAMLLGKSSAQPVEGHHTSDRQRVYFDSDMKVRAPFDAKSLRERVQRRLDLSQEPTAWISRPQNLGLMEVGISERPHLMQSE